MRFAVIFLTLCALSVPQVLSAEPRQKPADNGAATAHNIDAAIDRGLTDAKIPASPQADDAEFLRRVTLDLVGRIPTTAEVDDFVKSTDTAKRSKLVDRLLASPGFARHQAAQFEVMFNPDGERRGDAVRAYMAGALKDGKTWDIIFRELMLPDETDAKQKGASDYLRGRITDADKLTNDVSVAFFGVNVSCAQCHDHPLWDWDGGLRT